MIVVAALVASTISATFARASGAVCALDALGTVSVTACGAIPGDTGADTTAIQRANDIATAAGGGHVYFPPGLYLANNIRHDSNVEFYGDDRATTIIRHNATSTNNPLFTGREWAGTSAAPIVGAITEGSNVLTISDPTHVVPGSVISVRAAGGIDPVQTTRLTWPATAGATSLKVDSLDGFATLQSNKILLVGDEIVTFTGVNYWTKMITGVGRQRYGTVATMHGIGTPVGQALRLVAEVVSVDGNQVTLDQPAKVTVRNAPTTIGAVHLAIRGLTLDGNAAALSTNTNPWPLWYKHARWVSVTDSAIVNGEAGGMRLDAGTRDSVIEGNIFQNNGGYGESAHLWLFRGSVRNVVRSNQMSGIIRYGIMLDDRTSGSSEFDGPSEDNAIIGNVLQGAGKPTGGSIYIGVYGSARNEISQNRMSNATKGLYVGSYTQGIVPAKARDNLAVANVFEDLTQGIRTNGISNTFQDNTFSVVEEPCARLNELNIFLRNGPDCPDS